MDSTFYNLESDFSFSWGFFYSFATQPVVLFFLPGAVLLLLCWLATYLCKRSNPDGSFRVLGAPRSGQSDKVDWILPFQKEENIPKAEYERIRIKDDSTLLRAPILAHESIYGTMHLSLSSYYSRVYTLPKCSINDIDALKIAFSRALGVYPIMAGRCQPEGGRDRSVVLPVHCLVTGEEETNSVCSRDQDQDQEPSNSNQFGVPFRVYHITNQKECPDVTKPLSPKDTADWCVFEDPQRVMNGQAPICNICIYLMPNGGAILGLTISHAVMDGVSIANFEQVWAAESRKLFEMDPPPSPLLRQDPTAWVPHHQPLTNVAPVNRQVIPGPFHEMEDFREAQREFFGRVLDDSPTIDGTPWQHIKGWLMIEFLMPYLRFLDDLAYLLGLHPDQHKHAISIPSAKIKQLKKEMSLVKPDHWIASQDTIVAVLVQQLVQILQQKGRYHKQKVRVVLFRDARPYLGLPANHAYGLGVLNWPIDIDRPHEKSLTELAVFIRQALLDMQNDQKALRFWKMTTTVFCKRRWAFLDFVHKGLFDEGRSDDRIMINNSMFPMPDFGGSIGQAVSLTTSAGPTIMLPQSDGGCRLFIEKELHNVLTLERLQRAFA